MELKIKDIKLENYDYFIFGCGISGATLARRLITEDKTRKILIFETRDEIAGNLFDFKEKNGILVHRYGPHIFHSSDQKVIDFIQNFSNWKKFRHQVAVKVLDKEVPLPINFESIDKLFPSETKEIQKELKEKFKDKKKISIFDLVQSKNESIKKLGDFIYKNIFENYSKKMWGTNPMDLDKDILKRIPIILSYDDGYFDDIFQAVPEKGYTEFVKNIINDKNIDYILSVPFDTLKIENNKTFIFNKEINKPVVYTGMIDKLFNYKFGKLGYRSINFTFENLNIDSYQNRIVTNYPADKKMTRITEYKKLSQQDLNKLKNVTTIGREYPGAFDEKSKEFNVPCYPLFTEKEEKSHKKYIELSKEVKNLHLLGRLAEYKYKQMTHAVKDALEIKI